MNFTVVETAGDVYGIQREQWNDANNVVALEPGVVIGYDRNTLTNTALRKSRHRGDHHRRERTGPRPRWRPLHDLPDPARPRLLIPTNPEETTTCRSIFRTATC